ncbi:MAG: hypothetical protein WBA93_13515 [Microcoleaceae cyanobacterium]
MDKQQIKVYTDFLLKALQATADSNGNPEVVYPLLEANLDKLDHNFADILDISENSQTLSITIFLGAIATYLR